ncbi:MAG: accessory factor UbiK family protein [Gammaproteobacteria bacterium]|nr:accessory factor UbiK family protein [Gammaproteobacteria bacterium]
MLELKRIEEIAENIARLLPAGAGQIHAEVRNEVRNNVRLVLEAAFARMNLVTREEFDAQTAMLKKTREKLEELEHIVANLEEQS